MSFNRDSNLFKKIIILFSQMQTLQKRIQFIQQLFKKDSKDFNNENNNIIIKKIIIFDESQQRFKPRKENFIHRCGPPKKKINDLRYEYKKTNKTFSAQQRFLSR